MSDDYPLITRLKSRKKFVEVLYQIHNTLCVVGHMPSGWKDESFQPDDLMDVLALQYVKARIGLRVDGAIECMEVTEDNFNSVLMVNFNPNLLLVGSDNTFIKILKEIDYFEN